MPRHSPTPDQVFQAAIDPNVTPQKAAEVMHALRCEDPAAAHQVDLAIFGKCREMHAALEAQSRAIADLKDVVSSLTEEPWQAGTFLRHHEGGSEHPRAEVLVANRACVVGVSLEVEPESLHPGDEVYLNRSGSMILAKAARGTPVGGIMGSFLRRVGERILVEVGSEQMLLETLPALREAEFEPGDQVRLNRDNHIALERIERAKGREIAAKPAPVTRDQLGGQAENYEKLKFAISASLMHRDKAASYGIDGRNSVLVNGPPGTGKTLMLKVVASSLEQEYGTRCSLVVVKPGEWATKWYGDTERKIRETFASIQKMLEDENGVVILYLDEVDSIGRHRGTGVGHADDKALNALLAEIDGFVDRNNICIVSSTNSKELLDKALLERLAGTELYIGRPNARAAGEIFGVHLPSSTLPFSPNGAEAPRTREEVIQTGVSRLYAPNAGNKVAVIRFTDGKQREIHARELMSGRLIMQICKATKMRAYHRDLKDGVPGVRVEDMEEAVDEAIARLRTRLTRENARHHLSDLPQDVQILAVDTVTPRVAQPRRYLTQASHEAGSVANHP